MLATPSLEQSETASTSGVHGFPPPPMTAVVAGEWINGGEPTAVRLPDGTKIVGSLVDFRTDTATVRVKMRDGGELRTLGLDEVKLVQIITRGSWTPGPVGPADDQAPDLQVEARQFEVEFQDGDALKGRTLGFRRDRHGLYLFPLMDESRFFSTFVPHDAIARHSVGPRMGEMLVRDGVLDAQNLERALQTQERGRSAPLGETLVDQAAVTTKELEEALQRQQANLRQVRIGELLVGEGVISEQQLEEALTQQKGRRGKLLGEILVEMELISQADLHRTLAKKLGIPSVDLRKFCVDPEVVRLVPRELVLRYHVLPLCTVGGRLVLATENPLDWSSLEAVSFATGMHVDPAIAPREEIDQVVDVMFNTEVDDYEDVELDFSEYQDESEEELLKENQFGDNVVVALVNQIVSSAYKMGASDIHVEPNARSQTQVRVRKDGQMRTLLDVPPKLRRALVARIKVMAGLDITERRKPQDGRINLRQYTKMDLELRVATLPTMGGNEDVVMRLLRKQKPVPVDGLRLSQENQVRVMKALARPYGLFLVTGPTGSGKTTTLHSLLSHLNTGDRKIWTAEDPVEISQPGLRQLQVSTNVGLTFAAAIRAFLRADPDVIMVGEMRDRETAGIGIEASLTGHLVFSTLHTNSAPETVGRLLDMGLDPFNFADALVGVLAQRLARSLCEQCRQPYTPDEEEVDALAREYCHDLRGDLDDSGFGGLVDATVSRWRERFGVDGLLRLGRASGCASCDETGYSGRIALHELLEASAECKRMIQGGTSAEALRAAGLSQGMRTLRQDGIEKVVQGLTDIGEVRKVCAR